MQGLFRQLHPGCDIGIAFDHSMTHCKKAPDGLDASVLNLSDGGKKFETEAQPLLRNGWYLGADGERVPHVLHHVREDGAKVQKGVRTILKERGKFRWKDTFHEPKLLCNACKARHEKPAPKEGEEGEEGEDDDEPFGLNPSEGGCCAWRILSDEPDFAEQRPWLQETVENMGFEMIYFPKYHCELNFIEMLWGWMKAWHRRHCTYKFADLDGPDGVRKTLNERLPLDFVRRAARHTFRYIHGYAEGLMGALLDFAVRKFKGHRTITPEMTAAIKTQFENKKPRA